MIEKLGEKGAEELVERLGEKLIQELAEKGLTGKEIAELEKLFEKEGLEHLLGEGLTGEELKRLGAIDEEVLRKLLAELDAKEVLALEEKLGKQLLEDLAKTDLTSVEIERLTELFEKEGIEHLLAEKLTTDEMRRLIALDEKTLRALLVDLDVKQVLELEELLGKNALDKAAEKMSAAEIKAFMKDLDKVATDAVEQATKDALAKVEIERPKQAPAVEAELKRLASGPEAKEAAKQAATDALASGKTAEEAKLAAEKAAKDAADKRLDELVDFAKDPAHNKKLSVKSVREAEVGDALAKSGELKGPVTRDPNPKGGEFIDGDKMVWDVKTPDSRFPKKDMTVVDGAVKDIEESLAKPEMVIIDTKDLTPTDLADLKAAVDKKGWKKDKVKFFP